MTQTGHYSLFLAALLLFLISCTPNSSKENTNNVIEYGKGANTLDEGWNDYWYAGDAEVNYYKLEQYRYGEKRDADAVMIYVTEPFSKSKQVKLDDPDAAGDDRATVLKLNFNRKFVTGIYDYSIMQSVFTPVSGDYSQTLKATCSVQDWCGQAFSQINNEKGALRYRSFSYFESEGDIDVIWSGAIMEDEIWARLRMSPESLPVEEVMMVPSMAFLRLSHIDSRPYAATMDIVSSGDTSMLEVTYKNIDRKLKIYFDDKFPYSVYSWEETGSFGPRMYKNKAVLQNQLKTPYWQHNRIADSTLRKKLFEEQGP